MTFRPPTDPVSPEQQQSVKERVLSDDPVLVGGIMSGTSGDGISVSIIQIKDAKRNYGLGKPPEIQLIHHLTRPYEPGLKSRIFQLFDPETARLDELCRMNVLLADEFAETMIACVNEAGLKMSDLALVGSHGQTVCHLPPAAEAHEDGGAASTLQIGDVSVLAERLGIPAVGNFRLRDMAVGGEGAPLVPLFDWAIFAAGDRCRVVQNIGGIANLTLLPPGATEDDVRAWDTGPGNMLIDEAVRHVTAGQEEFDRDGERAARGTVDHKLLDDWLSDPYFAQPPPKSTGRERYGRARAQEMIAQAASRSILGDDLIATITELTVQSIVLHYRRDIAPRFPIDEVIVGGGGAKNLTLLRRLQDALPNTQVVTHEAYGIPSEAKESMAFAYLGYLTWLGLPGNIPHTTGAKRQVILGTVAK